MSYCTVQQLEDRYGAEFLTQISDRGQEPAVEPDAVLLARAIADADALIDGYLAARYALPLAATPPLLTALALPVALYKAHAHVASEKVRKDFEDALKVLERIASGVVRLDVAGVEPAGSGAGGVRTNAPERPFTAATMKGFV